MAARGFSLHELLIVLIIAAVAASLALPGFSRFLEIYHVRKAARQLVTDLQSAKMRAVAEGVDHRLCLVPGDKPHYVIERNTGGGLWVSVDNARHLADPASPYHARNISMETGSDPLYITFSPLGTANPPGSIIVRSPGNRHKTIKIIFTGRIRIE